MDADQRKEILGDIKTVSRFRNIERRAAQFLPSRLASYSPLQQAAIVPNEVDRQAARAAEVRLARVPGDQLLHALMDVAEGGVVVLKILGDTPPAIPTLETARKVAR